MAHIGRRYGDALRAKADEGPMREVRSRDRARIEQALGRGRRRILAARPRRGGDDLSWCGSAPLYTFLRVAGPVRGRAAPLRAVEHRRGQRGELRGDGVLPLNLGILWAFSDADRVPIGGRLAHCRPDRPRRRRRSGPARRSHAPALEHPGRPGRRAHHRGRGRGHRWSGHHQGADGLLQRPAYRRRGGHRPPPHGEGSQVPQDHRRRAHEVRGRDQGRARHPGGAEAVLRREQDPLLHQHPRGRGPEADRDGPGPAAHAAAARRVRGRPARQGQRPR